MKITTVLLALFGVIFITIVAFFVIYFSWLYCSTAMLFLIMLGNAVLDIIFIYFLALACGKIEGIL